MIQDKTQDLCRYNRKLMLPSKYPVFQQTLSLCYKPHHPFLLSITIASLKG